jgi:iduronate 2-sulfatase
MNTPRKHCLAANGAEKLNGLFLASDDMRPQPGCYGDPVAKSPHLDRLAAASVAFNRAFCQQTLSSPSRISLLTGRYPATTKVFSIGPLLRETMPDVVTLPLHRLGINELLRKRLSSTNLIKS